MTDNEAKHGRLSMEGMIDEGIRICDFMLDPNSAGIPKDLLQVCCGVALISSAEVALFVSGSRGTGIVLHRDDKTDEWSPPSAVTVSGVGLGLVVGFGKKDIVMVLVDNAAVAALSGEVQVQLGAQVSVAGPVGREYEGTFNLSNRGAGTTFTYAISKGLVSVGNLEGALVCACPRVNKKFYNSDASPHAILFEKGSVTAPAGSRVPELHKKLTMMEKGRMVLPPL